MTTLLMLKVQDLALMGMFLGILVSMAACGGETNALAPTAVQTPATRAANVTLPTVTPTGISVSPQATETPVIAAASPLTLAGIVTNTALAPAAGTDTNGCLLEPDVDLAGYEEIEARMGCPIEPAIFDPVGINEFGPGPEFDRFMLWFSSEQQIYVLYPDQKWENFADTWTEEQPTFSCNPLDGTPESPPLPRRGFGKLWCSIPGLQEVMGTISVEERLCQHTALQRFERGRLLACYEDATIRFIRLLNDGTWDTVLMR